MTISKDLFLAILSMDAYNRGYNPGIDDLSDGSDGLPVYIGNAHISVNLQDADMFGSATAAGFYAIAYEMDADVGEGDDKLLARQISYRGTEAAA